jgi:ubiquinone/menaquinone biosynthesis C-methylase UbiE
MLPHASQAQIDAATTYERLFVPAEFQEWAGTTVAAARIASAQHVLDVACGTGVVARVAAARSGSSGRVDGIDADPGMVNVAASLAPHVQYRQGTAEALPYADSSFDAVVCQFGLMFFTDRERALTEMQRVLRPRGRMAIVVWDTLQNTPAYDALVALLERVAGSRAAAALTAPFALGDKGVLKQLFEAAGIRQPSLETATCMSCFPSIRTMVEADLRGWLPVMGVVLEEATIEQVLREAEQVLSRWRAPDGKVRFESPAHIVTATKA